MTNVAIVAEHALLAEALATRMEAEAGFSVLGTATDAAAAINLTTQHSVDVILLDVDLPDDDGVALARRLLEIRPAACLIVLSGSWDPSRAAWALHYGARGLVLKGRPFDELLRAVRGALRDETRVPPRLLTEVLTRLTPTPALALASLTRREMQVYGHLVEGWGAAQVAARLQLSDRAIRTHLRNLLVKLGAQSPGRAVVAGLTPGLPPHRG